MTTRIEATFARLAEEKRGGLVTFTMAGDPDYATALDVMKGLPDAGADIIELGMPFTDPMADGPAIQLAGTRALNAGMTLAKTLDMVRDFRAENDSTPIVLMGYYNPIYSMGVETFLDAAISAGVDGLIVVDLPPEEDDELCLPAMAKGLNFIRLATPTTDDRRLPAVLKNTSGFVYYVSVAGITGAARGQTATIGEAVSRVKAHGNLPVVVGFGIRTADAVNEVSAVADAAVVGSALIDVIADSLDDQEQATATTAESALAFVRELASGKASK